MSTAATVRHIRYVLTENPVTLFAFALFGFILLCAIFGPWIAPYNPLQTNAAMALKPPRPRTGLVRTRSAVTFSAACWSPRGWIWASPSPL